MIKRTRLAVSSLIFLQACSTQLQSPASQKDARHYLEVTQLTPDTAREHALSCVPQGTSGSVDLARRLFENDGNFTSSFSHPESKSYYVARSRGQQKLGVCLQLSPSGYAVIPTDVLEKAIRFQEVDPARSLKWYETLQTDLARGGAAIALILFTNGNATAVRLSIDPGPAQVVVFDSHFMKAGSFSAAVYSNIIETAKSYSVVSGTRGNAKILSLFKD